jgi:hypothetical protein
MTQEAINNRNEDIRNGQIKEEWMNDPQIASLINALHEVTK